MIWSVPLAFCSMIDLDNCLGRLMGLEAASIPGLSPIANHLTWWISDRSGRFAEGACFPAVCTFSPDRWSSFKLTTAIELAREDISFSCSSSASSTVRAGYTSILRHLLTLLIS